MLLRVFPQGLDGHDPAHYLQLRTAYEEWLDNQGGVRPIVALQREHNEKGERGTMHVKCAIADARYLLISSANLTGFALNLNMEMGVLISGGHLPEQVEEHLLYLMKARVLQCCR